MQDSLVFTFKYYEVVIIINEFANAGRFIYYFPFPTAIKPFSNTPEYKNPSRLADTTNSLFSQLQTARKLLKKL